MKPIKIAIPVADLIYVQRMCQHRRDELAFRATEVREEGDVLTAENLVREYQSIERLELKIDEAGRRHVIGW
jgi:hypothetical protein